MASKNKTKQTGRNRKIAKIVKKVEHYQTYVPSLRQPTITGAWTMPHTLVMQWEITAGATVCVSRIEDLIKLDLKVPGLSISEVPPERIEMRVLDVCAYGLWNDTTKNISKSLSLRIYDPMTANPCKTNSAQGNIDRPPRLGYRLPPTASDHVYNWDGVEGTSNIISAARTVDDMLLSVYFRVVMRVSADWPITDSSNDWGIVHI